MVTRPGPRRFSSSASSSSRERTAGRNRALSFPKSTSELNRTLTCFSLSSTRAAPPRSLVGTAMSSTGATMSPTGAPGGGAGAPAAGVAIPSSTTAPSPAASALRLLDGDTGDGAEVRGRDIQLSDLGRWSGVGHVERVGGARLQVALEGSGAQAVALPVAGGEIELPAHVVH